MKDSLKSDARYKAVKHEDTERSFNEYISEQKAAEKLIEGKEKTKHDEEVREFCLSYYCVATYICIYVFIFTLLSILVVLLISLLVNFSCKIVILPCTNFSFISWSGFVRNFSLSLSVIFHFSLSLCAHKLPVLIWLVY